MRKVPGLRASNIELVASELFQQSSQPHFLSKTRSASDFCQHIPRLYTRIFSFIRVLAGLSLFSSTGLAVGHKTQALPSSTLQAVIKASSHRLLVKFEGIKSCRFLSRRGRTSTPKQEPFQGGHSTPVEIYAVSMDRSCVSANYMSPHLCPCTALTLTVPDASPLRAVCSLRCLPRESSLQQPWHHALPPPLEPHRALVPLCLQLPSL